MTASRPSRALALVLALAPALGGCVAAPLAQVAAQALLQPSRPASADPATGTSAESGGLAQLQNGMAQAGQKLGGLLHQVVGGTP